jgi:hypothetical protein
LEESVEELEGKNKKLERLKEKLEKDLKDTTEKLTSLQTKSATDQIAKKTVDTVLGLFVVLFHISSMFRCLSLIWN